MVLHLTVIDTPGFGDNLNREPEYVYFVIIFVNWIYESSINPIIEYIDNQYDAYHRAESAVRLFNSSQ